MGCFDSVMIPCPKCGTESEFQSKSGNCLLETFVWPNVPGQVLMDVNRHAPNKCENCYTEYAVWLGGYFNEETYVCTVHKDFGAWQDGKSYINTQD